MPLHRRVPKRGFHNPFRVEYEVVNLDTLGERFDAGTVVTPELLRERGLVPRGTAPIKVLARGEVGKALTVHAHKFSGKAAEKIAAAGGTAEAASRRTDRRMQAMDNSLKNIFAVSELRNRVLFTLGAARRLPHRQPHPDAGREHRGADRAGRAGAEHDVRPVRHVLGRQPVEGDDLRARHHAVHQRVDHPAAADGGLAVPREAVEGRRARAAARSRSTRATARSC